MGGSKDPSSNSPGRPPLLPRTQSMSNVSKALYIRQEARRDVARAASHLPYFQSMAMFMALVPPLDMLVRSVKEKVMQLLFDFSIWRQLEDARVVNWCPAAHRLYPLWTRGDGNCLPHAVSLYLWGIHDEELFLRRLIYNTLADSASAQPFRLRWQHERRYMNSTIPEGGVEYDKQEWDREWHMVVDLASDIRQDHDRNLLPYRSLEEIHIFVLANLIRRPIVILSEGVIRRMDGSSLAPNDIGGLYLPTLCRAVECIRSPVVLCYDTNHFVPLLSMDQSHRGSSTSPVSERRQFAVPIVTSDLGNLPVHFLTEEEESQVTRLLEEYLNLVELRWEKRSGQVDEVLAVAIHKRRLPDDLNLMEDFCAVVEGDVLSEQHARDSQNECGVGGCSTSNITPNVPTTREEKKPEGDPPHRRIGGSYRPNPGGQGLGSPTIPGDTNNTWMDVEQTGLKVGSNSEPSSPIKSIPLAVEAQRLANMESQPCVTEGCEFHGLPENGGRCSVCVKIYTSNMQSAEETAPNASHEPSRSRPGSGRGDLLRRSLSCREGSRTKTEEPRSFPSFSEAAIESSKCEFSGCDILASRSTYPYCITHQPRGTIISTVRGDTERAPGRLDAYYATRVSPENHSEHRCESNSLESVQVHFPKLCLIGGCSDYGVPSKSNMCALHFENYKSQAKKEREKKISFPSNPESPGSVHTNKFKRGTTGMSERNANLVMCQNYKCANRGVQSLQGYCRECHRNLDSVQNQQNEQQQNVMETFRQMPNDRPKSWAPAHTTRTGLFVNLEQKTKHSHEQSTSSSSNTIKQSNLPPVEEPLHYTKRSHELTPESSSWQHPEKTRRTYDNTLPQFSQYREPTESHEEMNVDEEPKPCLTKGCIGIQLKDSQGYCLRCDKKKSSKDISKPPALEVRTSSSPQPSSSLTHHKIRSAGSSAPHDQTAKSSTPPSGEESTSYEREMQNLPKCSFTACDNRGLDMNNGLCQVCFDLLATQRRITRQRRLSPPDIARQRDSSPPTFAIGQKRTSPPASGVSQRKSSPPAAGISATPSQVTLPPVTSNYGYVYTKLCRALACDMYGTAEKDGYCTRCYLQQSPGYLEQRQKEYGEWHREFRSDPLTNQPSPEPTSPSIIGKPCRNHHCVKYGDPAFKDFCSECYYDFGYRYPRENDVPVSYASVYLPPRDPPGSSPPSLVSSSSRGVMERESNYGERSRSALYSSHNIAKCKNFYLNGCKNYGNSDCKGYCNSCYVSLRLSLY